MCSNTRNFDGEMKTPCVITEILVLLMEKILHQLIGSVSHYLQGLYIPGGAGFLPSTVLVPYKPA